MQVNQLLCVTNSCVLCHSTGASQFPFLMSLATIYPTCYVDRIDSVGKLEKAYCTIFENNVIHYKISIL